MKGKQIIRLAVTVIAVVVGAMIMAGTTPVVAAVVVLNNSFEATTGLAPGNNYTVGYDIASVPDWTFVTGTGYNGLVTAGTSSGNTGGLQAWSPFLDGSNAAFIMMNSTFSQAISGFASGENYQVGFYSSGRPAGPQTLEVKLDSTTLTFGGASTITPTSSAWTLYTSDLFTTTTGAHTLSFTGVYGADVTSFIDLVNITTVVVPETSTVALLGIGALLVWRRRR